MKRWIVIIIGCLECHNDTKVIGVYKTKKEANKIEDQQLNTSSSETRTFKIEVPE